VNDELKRVWKKEVGMFLASVPEFIWRDWAK
jgi:hypothetical protein